jgi:hypothetical protein
VTLAFAPADEALGALLAAPVSGAVEELDGGVAPVEGEEVAGDDVSGGGEPDGGLAGWASAEPAARETAAAAASAMRLFIKVFP